MWFDGIRLKHLVQTQHQAPSRFIRASGVESREEARGRLVDELSMNCEY